MEYDRLILELPSGKARAEELRQYAERRGFSRFLVREGTRLRPAAGVQFYVLLGDQLRVGGVRARGALETVRGPGDLPRVIRQLARCPVVLVDFVGDRVIPLENLLAMRQGAGGRSKGRLWVKAQAPSEVPGLLGALEHGSDDVVVPVDRTPHVDSLVGLLDNPRVALSWKFAKLVGVRPGGLGERVAVDTTSLLSEDEGMLVGSQGAFLLHVVSEAVGSRYTRPRPFRVNAGAVHSYTLLSDGSTRYLSELEPGDRVVVAGPRGPPRSVRVGRLKVERRPLTLLEMDVGGHRRTLFAQEAETVRLTTPRGARAVPDLRAGDRVLGVALPPARHFGMAVEETLIER
jgi:3-dehydroquinate synthase II